MEIKKQFPKYLIACCACCGLSLTTIAQQASALRPYVLQAELSGIGSMNNNSWSVAGNSNGTSPDILSELKWNRQQGGGAGATLSAYPLKHWRIDAGYRRTGTTSGWASDRDYNGDNRTRMTYDGKFSSAKGFSQDWYTGAGYTFLFKQRTAFTGTLGYCNAQQLNYLLPADAFTPQDLSSTYKTTWKGVLIGIQTDISLVNNFRITAALNYKQLTYYAAGNWNLIQTFQHPLSFEHTANGYGINPELKAKYMLNSTIALFAAFSYEYRETGHGAETLYLKEGATAKTRLNAAYSSTAQLHIGLVLSSL